MACIGGKSVFGEMSSSGVIGDAVDETDDDDDSHGES